MAYISQVDLLTRGTGLGALSRAQTNNLMGINHRGSPSPVKSNQDQQGLTFFTRPRMNLSYDNLAQVRKLVPFLTQDDPSLQRMIRTLLDPVQGEIGNNLSCTLVDPLQAFIPVLSNNLKSLTGWPDLVLDTYTSEEGHQREAWSMVDSVIDIRNVYSLTATFRNVSGNPVIRLLYLWCYYQSMVYQGVMVPYPDSLIENEIDYMTRIYRLTLDSTRRFVTNIGATGAGFPVNSTMGSIFNYNSEEVYIGDNNEVDVEFQCIGADYNDPILFEEFNQTVSYFNLNMKDGNRSDVYRQVPHEELTYYNYEGYPRIDPYTQELQWWVARERTNG